MNNTFNYTRLQDPSVTSLQAPLTPVEEEEELGTPRFDGNVSLEDEGSYAYSVQQSYAQQGRGYSPLPAINSGEPLQVDSFYSQFSQQQQRDPFAEATASLSYSATGSGYLAHSAESPGRTGIRQLPSRPASTAFSDASYLPSTYTGYTAASTNYTGPSRRFTSEPPPDIRFGNDEKGYSSATYARASSNPPRSRSPTPFVDDEDYQVVGDESFHYTAPVLPSTRQAQQVSDPEKAAGVKHTDIGADTQEIMRHAANVWRAQFDPDMASLSTAGASSEHDEPPTLHYGPAPVGRAHRRNMKKRVQLTNGNLVVDLDVPPKMVLPWRGEPEMLKTRYTAVTCDPDEFEKNGFFLRQNEYGRSTELFIVITMYNVCLSLMFHGNFSY